MLVEPLTTPSAQSAQGALTAGLPHAGSCQARKPARAAREHGLAVACIACAVSLHTVQQALPCRFTAPVAQPGSFATLTLPPQLLHAEST
jgi:hypothetical protein